MVPGSGQSFLVVFGRDYTDEDVVRAESCIERHGVTGLFRMTSRPPKLSVGLADGMKNEQVEDLAAFLRGVDHVEMVKIIYPGEEGLS